VKFLIDMPLSPLLADWLKARGHDAVHAIHLAMGRSPDSDILERARIDERVVITADLDYPRLLAITRAEGPGLILFRGGNYSDQEAFERMERVLETTTPENLANSIVVIEKQKIRRRRLPL
jgi:predicted nuclease of predicted toxin-antitoxin system